MKPIPRQNSKFEDGCLQGCTYTLNFLSHRSRMLAANVLTFPLMASALFSSPEATPFSLLVALVALARASCLSLNAGTAEVLITRPLVRVTVDPLVGSMVAAVRDSRTLAPDMETPSVVDRKSVV